MGKLKKLRKKMLGAAARTTNRVDLIGSRPRTGFSSQSVVVDTEWDLITAPEDDADTAEYVSSSEHTTQSDSPPQQESQVEDTEDDPLLQDEEDEGRMSAGEPHAGTPPLHNHVSSSVLNQLKQRFEEVPESIVIKVLKENPTDLNKVLEILKQESDQRLYGQFVSAEMPAEANPVPPTLQPGSHLARQMSNLYMRGSLDSLDRQRSHSGSSVGGGVGAELVRQRSDSLESRGSVTSIGSGTSAGRLQHQNYGGTAGSPNYAGSSAQQTMHTSSGSLYIQMVNNNQAQQQQHGSSYQAQQGGASNVGFYPGTSIPYVVNTSGANSGQIGGMGTPVNSTSVGHLGTKTAVPERPPPPKFPLSNIGMYGASNSSQQQGQVTTPPGHSQHSEQSVIMHNSGIQNQKEPASRPGHFGQQFPSSISGSQYSSPGTPSPHRQGGLPFTPPRQVTFSPPTGQSPSPGAGSSGSPKIATSLHPNMAMGSPPTGNHTSQMFIQIAPGHTIPVAQVQSPSPGNPTVGYIIQHGVTTPGSGGSTQSQGSFVFIPASNWTPDSGIAAQPVTLNDLQTGNQSTVAVPLNSLTRQDDGAYTQALVDHQHQRLNQLSQDLGRTYIELDRLKRQVSTMEQDLLEKRRRKADTFPSAKDVQKMREDNRRMTIDIHLMTREVDGCSRGGQIPLGVVDTSFFNQIEPGQQLGNSTSPSRTPVPTRPAPPPPVTTTSSISLPPPPSLPTIPQATAVVPPIGPYYPHTAHPHDYMYCPKFHQHQPRVPCPTCQHGHNSIPPSHPPPPPYMVPPTLNMPQPSNPTMLPPSQEDEGEPWNCSACTFQNHPALEKCEVCEMPRIPIPGQSVPGHQMAYR